MKEKDLVFIGGGHTHALALRAFAMKPMAGVRITLVSEQTLTPYSGMLPGFVAGHYTLEQTHIDLNRLCQWAGVRWIKGSATHIDPDNKTIVVSLNQSAGIEHSLSLGYDKLSIDTGSTPDLSVPGAARYAVGVKPVSHFNQIWNGLLGASAVVDEQRWGVIGAGAGGVELVLAMAHRLRNKSNLQFHLVYSSDRVLPGYPAKLVSKVEAALASFNIQTHGNFRVAKVTENGLESKQGETLELDKSIWCTGASAAKWLKQTGIAVSERGFISVNSLLQSTSHTDIYAVGDCADMLEDPRPKAGVYAVRQAPYLVDNLRAAFTGAKTKPVALQSDFLSLLSLGDKTAVGCRSGWVASGQWVWRLKHYIDDKFMQRLNEPGPKMPMVSESDTSGVMHCSGCGSKLGPQLLAGNLSQLKTYPRKDITPALGNAEDASLWRVAPGNTAVQSIDGFRSFSDDLWRFGSICVNHALSDIYAMGAQPVSAQVWINLEFSHPRLQKRDHLLLMSGIAAALVQQEVTLAGGHSTEGAETHVAIVANGEITGNSVWRKNTPQEGDVLVLTKAIGSGVILAADMQARASAPAIEAAFEMMLTSNREIAIALKEMKPSAVTDVTGFGLLGHLLEMMAIDDSGTQQKKLGAVIDSAAVPLLAGALDLIKQGYQSTLYPHLKPYTLECEIEESVDKNRLDLFLDPQTSGGLLVSINRQQAEILVEQHAAVIIGSVVESAYAVVISA